MTESEKISEIDNMGREKFWECYSFIPPQENDGLALKLSSLLGTFNIIIINSVNHYFYNIFFFHITTFL